MGTVWELHTEYRKPTGESWQVGMRGGGLSKTQVQREMTGSRKRTNLHQIKSVHFIISWEELRANVVHGVIWYSYILCLNLSSMIPN